MSMGLKESFLKHVIGSGMQSYNAKVDVRKVRERGGALGRRLLLKIYRRGTRLAPWPDDEVMFEGYYISDGEGMRSVKKGGVDAIIKMHLLTFCKLALGEDGWGAPYGIRDAYFANEIGYYRAKNDKIGLPMESQVVLSEELFVHVKPALEARFAEAGIDLHEVVRRGG